MTAPGRWLVAALVALAVVAAPVVVVAWPPDDSEASAAELLAKVGDSRAVAYSGLVETTGALALPSTDGTGDLASLLGERNRLRVWWRDPYTWRVDRLAAAGETDLFHSGIVTTTWDYESARAVRSVDPAVRLPRASDLLPPVLGRLVLADALPDEVSRIGARRVAGVDAAGLRLEPSLAQSGVDHADVWVDPQSGLPLRVEVYGPGRVAALTSTFVDLDRSAPSADVLAFVPPPDAEVDVQAAPDLATAAEQYAPQQAPRVLAGLSPRDGGLTGAAVGEYGRGVTYLLAVPVWDQRAEPLSEQLADTPGVVEDRDGDQLLTLGPLSMLLLGEGAGEHHWLVAGTVTPKALQDAADELRARQSFRWSLSFPDAAR